MSDALVLLVTICSVSLELGLIFIFVSTEIHKCQRRKHDRFKKIIEDIMEQIEGSMLQCLGEYDFSRSNSKSVARPMHMLEFSHPEESVLN